MLLGVIPVRILVLSAVDGTAENTGQCWLNAPVKRVINDYRISMLQATRTMIERRKTS